MDIQDKLLASATVLSKTGLALLLSIATISAYLIQRSISVMANWTNPLNPQPQAARLGLAFSYLTLSILWPLILGALCLAFGRISRKRSHVLSTLRRELREVDDDIFNSLDPFLFNLPESLPAFRFVRAVFWLPITSISLLLFSQVIAYLRFSGPVEETFLMGYVLSSITATLWAGVNLLLQLLAVIVAFVWVRHFPVAAHEFLGSPYEESRRAA